MYRQQTTQSNLITEHRLVPQGILPDAFPKSPSTNVVRFLGLQIGVSDYGWGRYCVILYYIITYYITLYYTILYYIILYYIILYYIILNYIKLC